MSKIRDKNWARELSKGIIDAKSMFENSWIDEKTLLKSDSLKNTFDFRVPHTFKDKITAHRELHKQFVPDLEELSINENELDDPIGDEDCAKVDGITHRYKDRVLLKLSHRCASYCRFCFRKYKVSQSDLDLSKDQIDKALAYIQDHSELREVILTGGDPLSLTDNKLFPVLKKLDKIDHVKAIRFHTRILTVLPERIDDKFIAELEDIETPLWFVCHVNSHLEFSKSSDIAIKKLKRTGASLLSQSVLLKEINDSEEKLLKLFEAFRDRGIMSYYLHYPDLAKGTSHFRIPLESAMEMIWNIQGKISGYSIPKLIVDLPNGKGKVPVSLKKYHKGH